MICFPSFAQYLGTLEIHTNTRAHLHTFVYPSEALFSALRGGQPLYRAKTGQEAGREPLMHIQSNVNATGVSPLASLWSQPTHGFLSLQGRFCTNLSSASSSLRPALFNFLSCAVMVPFPSGSSSSFLLFRNPRCEPKTPLLPLHFCSCKL